MYDDDVVLRLEVPHPARCPLCQRELVNRACMVRGNVVFCRICYETATGTMMVDAIDAAFEETTMNPWYASFGIRVYAPEKYHQRRVPAHLEHLLHGDALVADSS